MNTTTEREIIKRCGWCGKDLGTKRGDFASAEDVTHGICDECAKTFLEDVKRK